MASTLPSSTSDYKFSPNEPMITPQKFMSQSYDDKNNDNMDYGLTMLLGPEEDYYPFFNYNIDNFLYPEYSYSIDSYSSDSNSMMEVPSFGTSCLDYYYNSQFEGHSVNSFGCATFDEFEGNRSRYSMLQNYVPSANNFAVTTPQCWGFQGHMTQACGTANGNSHNNNAKVTKYSVEERKDRILRYLNKRSQRNFRKTIKYTCRKTLADRRVRIRGRFAKNHEEGEESFPNDSNPTNQQDSVALPIYNADHEKEQCNDITEEFLQKSIASLPYDPYVDGWHAELHH